MIVTERLELVAATVQSTDAALDGPEALGQHLAAIVPSTWPPEYLDAQALEFTRARLSLGPEQAGWWLYFVVLPDGPTGRTLIGSAGYKGPPDAEGTVEVGYGIVSDQRRKGFASEVVRALIGRAFSFPAVARVIGETLPYLTASIGVMTKCGFRLIGAGSEPGVIRFQLDRPRPS